MGTPTGKSDFFVGAEGMEWLAVSIWNTGVPRKKYIRDNLFLQTPLITVDFVYVLFASTTEITH